MCYAVKSREDGLTIGKKLCVRNIMSSQGAIQLEGSLPPKLSPERFCHSYFPQCTSTSPSQFYVTVTVQGPYIFALVQKQSDKGSVVRS